MTTVPSAVGDDVLLPPEKEIERVNDMISPEMERLNLEMISDDTEVRCSALKRMDELARSRDVDATCLPSLMILMRSVNLEDRRRSSRIAAKMAQNRVEAFWPFDLLNVLTEDKDAEVRENAAWTLGELASMRVGVHSSITFLTELLLDREAMVRGTTSWALGQFAEHLHMSSQLAAERLEKLTYDRSPYVSKSATVALEIIRGSSSLCSRPSRERP